MSSAKTERLVNLTMALLGTKRFMTKAEIFRRVAGYSGNPETKERMFERDKDDLRSLGIEIEVSTHDAYFEDEVGYRIRPEAFQIHENFDAEELGLISLSLNLFGSEDFASAAQALNLRLNSLAVTPAMPDEISFTETPLSEDGLAEILKALSDRTTISFRYKKADAKKSEERTVNPLGVSAWRGAWYVVAEDLERDDIRAFKLSRIESGVTSISKPGSFQIPPDFDIKDYLVMFKPWEFGATLQLRKSAGIQLRNRATKIEELDDDWDKCDLNFASESHALREILWLGDDAVVISPESLRTRIIESLKTLVALHG
jgi:proteasome accessory factor B